MSRAAVTIFAALAASILVAPARAQTPTPTPAAASQPLPELVPGAPGGVAPAPELPSLVAQTPPAPAAPADPSHASIARRWWFWAGLGGAAVAVIVAGILLSPRDPYVGNAQPGTTTVF